jgi:PAT family beta-lactamase induction signal transducer AmpG
MSIITVVVVIEQLGWGVGAVGHMIYMMQQIAPGPYKTSHYAFATGFMALCMLLTGWVSGFIQKAVGYQWFFIIVMLAASLSLLATILAPFHQNPDAAPKPAEA